MAKEILKLDVQEKPTIFNKDMVIGGFLGALAIGLAGGIASALFSVPGLGTIGGLSGWAVGGYVGGSSGKSRTEYENENGKPVKQPGILNFINKDMFVAGLGTLIVTNVAIAAVTLVAPQLAPVASLIGFIGVAASPIAAIVGGVLGYSQKQKEYEQAKEQEMQRQLEQQRSRQPQHGLQQEHDLGQGKNHVKDLEAQRGRAQEYGMSVV